MIKKKTETLASFYTERVREVRREIALYVIMSRDIYVCTTLMWTFLKKKKNFILYRLVKLMSYDKAISYIQTDQ